MNLKHGLRYGSILLLVLGMWFPTMTAHAQAPGNFPFQRNWSRSDDPVATGVAVRTWMWGPAAFTASMYEPYDDSPGGFREVQYYDKSRMEITNPDAVDDGVWYVTNGLLAKEMVNGEIQMGANSFIGRAPAMVNVAGDLDDPYGPTYASFAGLQSTVLTTPGKPITTIINRAGNISDDEELSQYGVTASQYAAETNHWIAAPFWDFMNASGTILDDSGYHTAALFQNPYYATGFPITDAVWSRVKVAGTERDVLMQVFERRVLTYTPSNDPTWRVEMGNVGQHYYQWRYGTPVPTEPPAVDFSGNYTNVGATPLINWPTAEATGVAQVAMLNLSPYEMTVTFTGPTSYTMVVPPCPTCVVYPSDAAFDGRCENPTSESVALPAGNYRIQVTWASPNIDPAGGPWTLVPDAQYQTCWYVVHTS